MRVVRIVPLPALDAALLHTRLWWEGLSRREQLLVGTLATLLALALLVYGVVKPLQAARAQALADIRTYDTLNARLRAMPSSPAPAVPARTGTPDAIVTASASGFGLAPQVEAIPGGVRVTIAEAPYDSVVGWLADLDRTSSLSLIRADLARRPTPGLVSARVEFRG